MKILVACEESQRVCISFRELGHEAYSCDIVDCSGGHPEWHLKTDVKNVIQDDWDLIIAHPPCTYLTVSGNRWFNVDLYKDKALQRLEQRKQAIEFFLLFTKTNCPLVAIENPIGIMSSVYRKPDQIIHPFMFGDPIRKTTCLWLFNLPPLLPLEISSPNIIYAKNGKSSYDKYHYDTWGLPQEERSKIRSKTPPGFAKAMALQWSNL